MGKKKLAYPIKIKDSKHECKDGWYILFTYKMLPENIAKIETKLRVDGAVIKFLTVKREDSDFANANRIVKFLKYFVQIDDSLVPNNSILREFIGDSYFK